MTLKHPGYDIQKNIFPFDNDIGLVKLEATVNYTEKILPICLPNSDFNISIGRNGMILGWGYTMGKGF